MTHFKVNIDFEKQLFDPSYNEKKFKELNEEFEHLFIWTEEKKHSLSSCWTPAQYYIEYVEGLRGFCPKISEQAPEKFWWGSLEDIENEKKWNSKMYSTELGIQHDLCHPETAVVKSLQELEQAIKNSTYDRFWIRDPFQFSSRGSFRLQKGDKIPEGIVKKLKRHSHIFDPHLQRVRDYGVIIENENQINIVQNLNDKFGQFKGAIVNKQFVDNKVILNEMSYIEKVFLDEKISFPIQLDCFFYFEEGEIKFYPLVEINHRKSMGHIALRLSNFIVSNGVGALILIPKLKCVLFDNFLEKIESLGRINYNSSLKKGVIALNEKSNFFDAYYIVEQDMASLQLLLIDLWEKVTLKNEGLPLEFVIEPQN